MSSISEEFKPYIDRLGSMSLAIVLLVILSLASVIGTVLIQNQEQADYFSQFGPLWYGVFRLLGLFDMYHSWWFICLLGFLMVSLIVCLWRNTPRMLKEMRRNRVIIADKSLQRFHHLKQWNINASGIEPIQGKIESLLKNWRLRSEKCDDRVYLRADKGRYNKSGYILVHAAILIILTGGLLSVQFGFRGNMAVPEGGTMQQINFLKGTKLASLNMPFSIRCNDFNIDFYPSGQPKEFKSNLTILEDGKEILTSDIIVNEPLYYKGVSVYQASFGDGGSKLKLKLFRLDGSGQIDAVEGTVYEKFTDEETGLSLEFTDFKPFNVENVAGPDEPRNLVDLGPAIEYILRGPELKTVKVKSFMNPFDIDGENLGHLIMISFSGNAADYQPFYMGMDFTNVNEWKTFNAFSRNLKNPKVSKEEASLEAFRSALFEVFGEQKPDNLEAMGLRLIQSVNSLKSFPWPFVPILDDYEQVYYTGLQLTNDPGINVVWVGSGILVIGLCIMFYFPHRKLWAVLEAKGKGVQVRFAGMSNRNRMEFEKEFHDILSKLDDNLRSIESAGGKS
ncbi:MAG: cytochrome c biogenesis protein ResB [Mariprofundaceae bacterium]